MRFWRSSPESRAAFFLAAAVLAFFGPIWLRGRTPFWGDLTYLHQAWRASPAQLVQSGRAPLWEPSLYMGMPMAASMQGALFYPTTIFFYFFGFATATAVFEIFHLFCIAWMATLWLRSLRVSWGASAASGATLALSGLLISRLPFLNHLAVLSWMPALALFFRRPAPLALSLALMYLAGYPTFIPGAVAVVWGTTLVLRRVDKSRPNAWLRDWSAAGAAALACSSAQLLPALELTALSRRSSGVIRIEALQWGFHLRDLRQWISPLLVPLASFRPEVDWWKCVYWGALAAVISAWGASRMPRRRATALVLLLAVVVLLILGDSTPVSRWLWNHWLALRYVRYPGNLSYLALLPLTLLSAAGFSRTARAPALAVMVVAELLAYGWLSTPTTNRTLFTEAGPLVSGLQARLNETRYLISPRALEASSGNGFVDWKTRLYGLTNAPYRLRAVANFGEPLVPQTNYEFMDRILSAASVDEAASWMPWAGASRLLTPAPVTAKRLQGEGRLLWEISRANGPVALAYFFNAPTGVTLPETLPDSAPALGQPLTLEHEREDRYSVSGEGAGEIFIAEPRYPGWRATLRTPSRRQALATRPALGVFSKAVVPAGPWHVAFEYDPASWHWGVAVSLFALLAFAAYWYHRASRIPYVAQ